MAIALKTTLALAVFGVFGAAAFYGYLWIAGFFWPLDAHEAAGPQAARFMGAALSGFLGLSIGGIVSLLMLLGD